MDANGHEARRETIGFVGLGRMGWPMATTLVQRRWAEAAHAPGFAADHSLAHEEWWDVDLSDAVPR